MKIKTFLIVLSCVALSACSSTANKPSTATIEAPAAKRPTGLVIVRDYVDSVKTDHGDQYQKIQYGWDYDRGTAIERISTLEGELISEKAWPTLTLRATDAEMEYAYSLVRADQRLKSTAERKDARFYGGFSFADREHLDDPNRPCQEKSRCVHVMVSGGPNGEENIAHAIVDLALGQVVIPNYDGQSPTPSKN